MTLVLPTWSHAELIVSHGGLTVGVFPSTKPWMPRHKEHRFLAVNNSPIDIDETPQGGTPLASLKDSVKETIEERDFVVLAGEAEGHKSVSVHAGGDGWTVVVAADAWVALGPRTSGPKGLQIGPHRFDLIHLAFGPSAIYPLNESAPALLEFRVPD